MHRQKGITLVELMVALVIGLVAALVIQQVMANFEGVKRSSSSGADAQVNGAVALMTLEREIRQAGYGILSGAEGKQSVICPDGVNIYFNGQNASLDRLLPIRIIDGGADTPDLIDVAYARHGLEGPRVELAENYPPESISFRVRYPADLRRLMRAGDLYLLAGKNADKLCTIGQLSRDVEQDQQNAGQWRLYRESNGFPYNPPNNFFGLAPDYYQPHDSIVIPLGFPPAGGVVQRRYAVDSGRLVEGGAGGMPLVDQVVTLQAQYGIAAPDSTQIAQWCDARADSSCGEDWSNPAPELTARIRAVRIAVVARSIQFERDEVSPASFQLWQNDGLPGDDPPVLNLSPDDRHFRYKVFVTIVPLRNVIWGTRP